MSFATTINIVTIILCCAVLVQCARMTRSLQAFREADLPGTAAALDLATGEARRVLREISDLLSSEADPRVRSLEEARGIADELAVMIGIANATADRLLDAARANGEAGRDAGGKAMAA